MVGDSTLKKYYWQLTTFKQCDSFLYKDMKQPESIELYVYKEKHPDIIVRLLNPVEKIHGWAFTELEVLQKMNDNPKVFHWKSLIIPFKGELVLSLLLDFKKRVSEQIRYSISRVGKALESWLESQIVDVFSIKQRHQQVFGGLHSFMEVRALYRNRYVNYFERRAWTSTTWEGLLDMALCENIHKTQSFGSLLEEINQFIMSFEVVRQEKYRNMFDLYAGKKRPKKAPKDEYQKGQERKALERYHLYEYIEDK